MYCQHCKGPMELGIEITGGCRGHFSEGDYCYCDEKDFHIYTLCTKARCKLRYKRIKIPGLMDQYSVLRWIKERMDKEDGCKPTIG